MSFLSLSAGMALTFGALHALEPGHGKTAMISYVASGKKSFKDGLVISITSAITHSIAVFVIALLSHFFFYHAPVEHNVTYFNDFLSVISGGIIFSIGLWYLFRNEKKDDSHTCCSCSTHINKINKKKQSNLLTSSIIGMAAGLMPCPTILIAYLTGVSSSNSLGGIESVVLFSIGMFFSLLCLVTLSSVFGEKIIMKMEASNIKLNWRLIQGYLFLLVGVVTAIHH